MNNRFFKAILMVAVFFGALNLQAQDDPQKMRTLFNNGGIRSNGGYGAVTVGYTQIANADAITIGGQGAWLINHQFGIGLAGTGFITERAYDANLDNRYLTTGGYGGLMLEFIAMPHSPVHLSFPVTIGAGGISYVQSNRDFDFYDSEDSQAFFVVEPGVDIEFNLLPFVRFGLGVKYRVTSDIDLTYLDSGARILEQDAMTGFSTSFNLKFGKF
ncbi:hypothetical protein [Roseivirga sp.]|uniref:hypothetical protein n=1 Tax=Roseivirga sp. TaxID=1964215 RepID=UPI003B5299B1